MCVKESEREREGKIEIEKGLLILANETLRGKCVHLFATIIRFQFGRMKKSKRISSFVRLFSLFVCLLVCLLICFYITIFNFIDFSVSFFHLYFFRLSYLTILVSIVLFSQIWKFNSEMPTSRRIQSNRHWNAFWFGPKQSRILRITFFLTFSQWGNLKC